MISALRKTYLLIGAIVACWSSSAPAREVPGSTQASLSVSPDGAAVYSVPLQVPPGTGGMEPKLTLVYSSRGGQSAFGYGWSLSGLSSIQRGPRNLRDDGEVSGVSLGADSALYLDGEALVEVQGTDPLIREFRSRMDNLSRITSYGWSEFGPERLVVETRSGLIMSYGARSDARVSLKSGETITWLCDKITDRAGNYMTFHYVFDQDQGVAGIDHAIDRIAYTANDAVGLAPYAELKFNYRAVAAFGTRYVLGQKTSQTRLIESIVSSFRGQVLRRYHPTYAEPNATQFRYAVTSIAEEGASGTRFRPLKFDYTAPSPHWTPRSLMAGIENLPELGDVSAGVKGAYRYIEGGSAGKPLIIVASSAGGKTLREAFEFDSAAKKWLKAAPPPPIVLGGDQGEAQGVAVVDVDGDGRDDLLSSADTLGNEDAVFINKGGGTWATFSVPPPVPVRERSLAGSGLLAIDLFDDSGKPAKGFAWNFKRAGQAHKRGAVYWTGSGWKQASNFRPPYLLSIGDKPIAGVYALDVNGDGVRELVYHQRGAVPSKIYRATPAGWDELTDPAFALPFAPPPSDTAMRFADMNKDGYADVVLSYGSNRGPVSAIYLVSAMGWSADLRALPPIAFWTPQLGADDRLTLGELGDLNGDGMPDFFQTAAGDRSTWVATGDHWEVSESLKPPSDLPSSIIDREVMFRLVSLDGDSQPEWLDLGTKAAQPVPAVYAYLPASGWRRDKSYTVPIDVSVYDKADLGVRFIDLNADGYQDLVWSRRRTDGSLNQAAYVFTPNEATVWRKR